MAELSCGHGQHVRHQPPFTMRPWVVTPEGRQSRLGQTLDCTGCDRREMPKVYTSYKRTAVFTRASVPAGLLREHRIKAGVWGLLHVQRGRLEFHEVGQPEPRVLSAGEEHTVLPEVEHHVAPVSDDVEFFVEFFQAPAPKRPN